jgi:hypothetical protein
MQRSFTNVERRRRSFPPPSSASSATTRNPSPSPSRRSPASATYSAKSAARRSRPISTISPRPSTSTLTGSTRATRLRRRLRLGRWLRRGQTTGWAPCRRLTLRRLMPTTMASSSRMIWTRRASMRTRMTIKGRGWRRAHRRQRQARNWERLRLRVQSDIQGVCDTTENETAFRGLIK